MASLKELKDRIGSVKSTQKITKAKQMVAAAKLRRAQSAAEAARPYAERLAAVMASLATKVSGDSAPRLLAGTGSNQKHLLVVVNTDKGLCGGLNSNIVKEAKAQAKQTMILAQADADADVLRAEGSKQAADLLATNEVSVDLAKIERTGAAIAGQGNHASFFFGADATHLQGLLSNNDVVKGSVARQQNVHHRD